MVDYIFTASDLWWLSVLDLMMAGSLERLEQEPWHCKYPNPPDLTHTHTVRPSPRNTETQTYNTLDLNTNQTPTSKHLPWFTTCLSCHFFLPVLPSSTCANSLTNFSLWATRWASPTPVSGKKTTQAVTRRTNSSWLDLIRLNFIKLNWELFSQWELNIVKCIDGDD